VETVLAEKMHRRQVEGAAACRAPGCVEGCGFSRNRGQRVEFISCIGAVCVNEAPVLLPRVRCHKHQHGMRTAKFTYIYNFLSLSFNRSAKIRLNHAHSRHAISTKRLYDL
jgi:hypothetical protein